MSKLRDVIIIGSGPAGLTAAIYAARANLQPLVVEGEPSSTSDRPGGQLMLTELVENYPGFPDGVLGPELMQAMRAQAGRFGAEFVTAKAGQVSFSGPPHTVWIEGEEHQAHAIIVATGARSIMLGLENERRLIARGVSTCATCDGFFFRDQHIAVVGGGDSAMEEALFLTKFAEQVTVIHRRDKLRASKIMQNRAFANSKIDFRWNTIVTDVVGKTKVEGLRLRDVVTDAESLLPVTGLFVAVGHVPNTDLFKGWLEMNDSGYLLTHHGTSFTNIEGVFACGDCHDHVYRQAVTAAGAGCMAAIDAERWLESRGDTVHPIAQTVRNW